MMCCQACPFHPGNDANPQECSLPRCLPVSGTCHRDCEPTPRFRCPQDDYVVRGLPKMDPLAILLSPFTLDTACEGRDRRLLVDLFHGASEAMRGKLWQRLGEHRERALWMINPLLEAAGLPPADSSPSRGDGLGRTTPVGFVRHPGSPDTPASCGQSGRMAGTSPSLGDSSGECHEPWGSDEERTMVGALARQEPAFYGTSRPVSRSGSCRQAAPSFGAVEERLSKCGTTAVPAMEEPCHRVPERIPMVTPDEDARPGGILAEGMRLAGDRALERLRCAVAARDADSLCDLFLDVPAMLRSALWRYLLLFHAEDLDLLNPLFERGELPPIERGNVPVELGDYRQALWNE